MMMMMMMMMMMLNVEVLGGGMPMSFHYQFHSE